MLKLFGVMFNYGSITQIHDSIMVECPEFMSKEVAGKMKTTMEQIAPEISVSLAVDVHIAQNWGNL